jgi:hypothetical protein
MKRGRRSYNEWFNYAVLAGFTTVIMVNIWSGQRANDVFKKGYNFAAVSQDARYMCAKKFGRYHEELCSLVTKPGVVGAYLVKSIEDKLTKEQDTLTFLSLF